MLDQLFNTLNRYYEEMVSIRRYLHQHPELSNQEYQTAKYIKDFYTQLGVEVRSQVGGNGVVAKIYGGKPGKTVALRADFDALPIQDEKDVPYKSKVPGVMHACGHDGHTATLLVLAKTLYENREQLEGTYVMIHQHAEEGGGGALQMIQDGCLEGVDVIYGTHLWTSLPTGTVAHRVGPIMAAGDRFQITIQGHGGHGSQPHKTKDAIVTASQLVVNLQQIVSRKVNPLESGVVSVGSFISDNAFNVIADRARIGGTVRTFNEDIQNLISEELERVTKGTCYTSDSTYDFQYTKGYPAVVNHEKETEFLAECAKKDGFAMVQESEPEMAAEDFAYYLQHIKGSFFFTGARPEDPSKAYPHHHPKFDIDEKSMLIAAKTLCSVAVQYHSSVKEYQETAAK
ncbi:M20 family metallopeptidase [Bacillus sp. 03113]|uniref:M20 family metallopeptidase n=1 Tax=Bacillus sp. 03113 TaxID=2578211 RepID=UPI001144FB40|nr:M20 family metallopeptidase [Bacillus sp. 03113]